MRLKFFGLCALCALSITSCKRDDSDTANQDTIWSHYELFHDVNEATSYAHATFRSDNPTGIRLELSDEAEIRFNDEPLIWRTGGAYYEQEFGGLQESGTFVYNDLEGATYSNSIELIEVDFPTDIDSIPRTEFYEFFWTGSELGLNESVSLWIHNEEEFRTLHYVATETGSESIIIPAEDLAEFPEGKSVWSMERSFNPDIHQATSAGGHIISRYRCQDIEVYMK